MIEELTFRRQTPTPPMDWLYHDEPDGNRIFKKEVYLGKNAEPWPECTDEEKVKWEEEQHLPEPDPEPSDVPADPANVPANEPANEGKEAEV